MSVTKEEIATLRNILLQAKAAAHQDDMEDGALFKHCLDTFYTIGKEGIYELTPELYDLLDVRDEVIRSEAVATLGFSTRLGLPNFHLKAYELFLNDPSDDVKHCALNIWMHHFSDMKNPEVMLILYKIFNDKNYSFIIRELAYHGIFASVDYVKLYIRERSFLLDTNTEEEFQAQINWNKLNKVLIEYIPEVFEGKLPDIPSEKDERGSFSRVLSWLTRLLCSSKKSSTP